MAMERDDKGLMMDEIKSQLKSGDAARSTTRRTGDVSRSRCHMATHIKGGLIVLLTLFVIMQAVGFLLLDQLMFHPEMVCGGYGVDIPGFVDIGTKGNRIAAVRIGPEHGRKAVLFCHGNAQDITAVECLRPLADAGFTVLAVDYPGYGLSDGKATEEGCYRNVHYAYEWLVAKGFAPTDIIVAGYSIGTGPATELASSQQVGGLFLVAPFLSAPRAVTRIRVLLKDAFPNVERIHSVACPVAIVHGEEDALVPFAQGRMCYERTREPKRFVAVSGAGHVDVMNILGGEALLSVVEWICSEMNP